MEVPCRAQKLEYRIPSTGYHRFTSLCSYLLVDRVGETLMHVTPPILALGIRHNQRGPSDADDRWRISSWLAVFFQDQGARRIEM